MQKKYINGILTIFIFLSLGMCIVYTYKLFSSPAQNVVVLRSYQPVDTAPEVLCEQPLEPSPPQINITIFYPRNKLVISADRKDYLEGTLQLVIPCLDVNVPVMNGVDFETLKKGVGLYDYAQLPSHEANSNTSIAGHRDIYGCEFYYLDQIAQGDQIILEYDMYRYVYDYISTEIVSDDDWSPIYSKDFSCVTLTTCDPIGTSLNRMIVTGKLASVELL